MKRRIVSLVLALAMVFSMSACGQSALQFPNSKKEAKKLSSVENCHLVLRLTINPQFEIYLDEAGMVLKVTGGNKDGKQLLTDLELTGLSYADAVNAILAAAAEQGLLIDNAYVQIDVLASADGALTFEETQQLEQVVTEYDEDFSSTVDQSAVVAAECGADLLEVEHAENGDVWYSYYSNMKLIREIRYGADGSYSEWVYQPWGIASLTTDAIEIDPDGTRQEEHTAYEDGIQTYHQVMIQQGDYTQTEEAWYEDGYTSHTKVQYFDGSYAESTYYSNGNMKTQKNSWADGTVQEQSYYENGECAFSKVVYPDGRVQERSYHENGMFLYGKDVYPDGASHLEEYNADGSKIYFMKTDANGDWEKEVYYPNGGLKCKEGSVGGEYYIIHYDEDGYIIE